MYWVIQENLYDEKGLAELLDVLERAKIPHSTHKVVPFSGDLIPDVNPANSVIAIGAYSMINIAKKRNWKPGVWSNDNFDFKIWSAHWGSACLNHDAKIYKFVDVPPDAGEFFIRPTMDSKSFSGQVFEWEEFAEWQHRVVALKEEDGSTLRPDTSVMVCSPKDIFREYRMWIVDGEVATASQYKLGDRVVYDPHVDLDVLQFGRWASKIWMPDRAFVLDVALTRQGYKIVEINSLNAAGLYAANVGKLVEAIEGMGYGE